MTRIFLLTYFIPLLLPYSSFAQEYTYTHYDITEGLAGSTVYCMTQDKDGFIWAATETGVSRFDGTHFRNFTMADGLPDIEVLQMFGDSKGRVWMAPFRKSVCYYYKGRIYNQENDSLLGRIHLRENVENFEEDSKGNILIQENSGLHLLTVDGRIREYDSIGNVPVRASAAICRDSSGHFLVEVGEEIVSLTDTALVPVRHISFAEVHPNYIAMNSSYLVWRKTAVRYSILSFATGNSTLLPFERDLYRHISFTLLDDSMLYLNEMSGCTQYNIRTGESRRFLQGKAVSRAFSDQDGNLWFSTLGQGIFRLNSDEFKTVTVPTGDADHTSIQSILRIGHDLWIGNDHNQLLNLSLPDLHIRRNFHSYPNSKNRLVYLDTIDGDKVIVATDDDLGENSLRDSTFERVVPVTVKSVAKKRNGNLLVASDWGVGEFDLQQWRFIDTIWRERSTAVYYYLDTVYVGTLNGLYRLNGRSSIGFLGEKIPFLRTRISAIVRAGNGIFWIASYGAGIIGYRHDTVVAILNKKNGLTSDICRNLLLQNNTLWAGTDKGLNKIELDKPGYPITQYTSDDGLGSDIVNVVYADGGMIYAGTPAGLSYFDQNKAGVKEGCRLYLLSVMNGGKDRTADTARLVIPYVDRNVQFGFAGISFRSAGDIVYRYRMMGLDSVWRTTRQTVLEYPILPPGQYEFQLSAINKFGIGSAVLYQRFSVTTPFWLTLWFEVLVVVFFTLATWGLATWRIRTIRRRQKEKERLMKERAEMENKALQAQMNPHFIFNCLNSIQQFIFDHDILSMNNYLTGFAKLIRATLHHSSQPFISVADEVDYLSTYLSLEKMRFRDEMDYLIEIDPAIDKDASQLPPMLIQPYVENSMRHGLRHLKAGKGYIHIQIRPEGGCLIVVVEDNGVGREQSMRYKTREHIEYQSKGMSLTAERMRIIGAVYGGNIDVKVEDMRSPDGKATGTRIVITLPEFQHGDHGDG